MLENEVGNREGGLPPNSRRPESLRTRLHRTRIREMSREEIEKGAKPGRGPMPSTPPSPPPAPQPAPPPTQPDRTKND